MYTLAFALQLRKKHGRTSVRVAGECQLAKGIQSRAYLSIRIHTHNICSLKYLILNPMDVKWDVSLCSLVVKCQYTRFHIPEGCHYLVWRCKTPTLTHYLLIASFFIPGTRWTGSCEDPKVVMEVVDKKKMFRMLVSQNFIFFLTVHIGIILVGNQLDTQFLT
jgi:hypothetical protein